MAHYEAGHARGKIVTMQIRNLIGFVSSILSSTKACELAIMDVAGIDGREVTATLMLCFIMTNH